MAKCGVCGNEYDKSFTVTLGGRSHAFDAFECAIHALAPACAHWGCKIVGHGVEHAGTFYCWAHWAQQAGVWGLEHRARGLPAERPGGYKAPASNAGSRGSILLLIPAKDTIVAHSSKPRRSNAAPRGQFAESGKGGRPERPQQVEAEPSQEAEERRRERDSKASRSVKKKHPGGRWDPEPNAGGYHAGSGKLYIAQADAIICWSSPSGLSEDFRFWFPVSPCILLSLLLTGIVWLCDAFPGDEEQAVSMSRASAGLLMYRMCDGDLQVLLVHPGGPFFQNKDEGSWSIPKGEIEPGEDFLETARREFEEEIGVAPTGPFIALAPVKQKGGKVVHAWAFEGDCDPGAIGGSTFTMEWPPRAGQQMEFPEIDRAGFFDFAAARRKINAGQLPLIHELVEIVKGAI